jgi:manganese/zinc/iron transport system permease protein
MDFISSLFPFSLLLAGDHIATVLLGSAVIGAMLGAVGAIALMRREALLGDALAHCTLIGVVVAFLVTGQRDFLILFFGALVSATVGLLVIKLFLRVPVVKPDAALAVVLAGFFGLGLIGLRIVQVSDLSQKAGLESFIFGKASLMTTTDVAWAIVVGITAAIILWINRRSFAALCFDSIGLVGFQRKIAGGKWLSALLLLAAVAVALPATGVILTCSLLVIPASVARFTTHSFPAYVMVAALCGALSGYIGATVSVFHAQVSTGAAITLTAMFALVLTLLGRGLSRALSRRGVTPQ